ncbi:MAG: hypothetical protein ACFB2Z_12045 [Maricaulaceae bacterium]
MDWGHPHRELSRASRWRRFGASSLALSAGLALSGCAALSPTPLRYYDEIDVASCSLIPGVRGSRLKFEDFGCKGPNSSKVETLKFFPLISKGIRYKDSSGGIFPRSVGFSAVVVDNPPSGDQLFDLDGEGQSALIGALTPVNAAQIGRAFAQRVSAGPSQPLGVLDDRSRTDVTLRVHFTIYTQNYLPFERITEAAITLKPPAGWRVRNVSGIESVRQTLRVGSIEETSASSGTLTAEIFPLLNDFMGNATVSRTSQGSQNLDVEVVEVIPVLNTQEAGLKFFAPFPSTNVAGDYTVNLALRRDNPGSIVVFDFERPRPTNESGMTEPVFQAVRWFYGSAETKSNNTSDQSNSTSNTSSGQKDAVAGAQPMPAESGTASSNTDTEAGSSDAAQTPDPTESADTDSSDMSSDNSVKASFSYVLRTVEGENKARSIKESDDNAIYYHVIASDKNRSVINLDLPSRVNADQNIYFVSKNTESTTEYYEIDLRRSGGNSVSVHGQYERCLMFRRERDADDFLEWIKNQSPQNDGTIRLNTENNIFSLAVHSETTLNSNGSSGPTDSGFVARPLKPGDLPNGCKVV